MFEHILSWLIFIPIIGMGVVLALPAQKHNWIRWTSVVATVVQLILAILLLIKFDRSGDSFQFLEKYEWISAFNISYFVGVDGLSMPMVILTPLLMFLSIFASWSIKKKVKGYFAMFLLLDAGMMGVFVSLDFFLFYIFWEVMLLPMYFLIGIWGGPKREYAAIKFFLYTLAGSVVMLLAMIALYFKTGTFSFLEMQTSVANFTRGFQIIIFLALFFGFAIKVPIFPFHTWLPLAHVEAPTAISVILAGVLLKMGTYGILRISYPIVPEGTTWFAPVLAILGLINVIYGAMCALAQTDLKKLVAYSSINHMGYVLLGMAAVVGLQQSSPESAQAGMNGALFQMFNHGTITAMLFMLVGIIYERAHHRDIDGFGGLANKMPIYAGIVAVAFFAGLGLPGFSGFISEAMCFIGAFPLYTGIAIAATLGILFNAGYFLWAYQRIFLGKFNEKYSEIQEITKFEIAYLVPLVVITIFLGIYPQPMLDLMKNTIDSIIEIVNNPITLSWLP